MQIEIEAKVLEINKEEIEKKLRELGADFNGRFEQKRYTYNIVPASQGKWIRLRSSGGKTTLCYKSILDLEKKDGTDELEFEVPDFDLANEFMKSIGVPPKQYQENVRTQYHLDGVEIDIDEWPLIPTYLEVEGKSKKEVMDTIEKLGLKNSKISWLNTQQIYEMYGINVDEIKDLRFSL